MNTYVSIIDEYVHYQLLMNMYRSIINEYVHINYY